MARIERPVSEFEEKQPRSGQNARRERASRIRSLLAGVSPKFAQAVKRCTGKLKRIL